VLAGCLAEPDDELAQLRMRILGAVAPKAGLLTATASEPRKVIERMLSAT
jgi:hypothetical protein